MPSRFLRIFGVCLLAVPAASIARVLHSFHCWQGCPVGSSESNDVVVREIYTLSSNPITKLADWVAYRVTPASIGPSPSREWMTDPWLRPDETLAPPDYADANKQLHVDRGHQAPLSSFAGTPFAADTNYLSNITPQSSAVNQGPWVRLENAERDLAKRMNTAVYVVTGPLFERPMRPLPKGPPLHRVPSGYWKVVALEDGRVSAFLFDQATGKGEDFCTKRVVLTDIVLRARLQLFPRLVTLPAQRLDEELGCTGPVPPAPPPSEIPSP